MHQAMGECLESSLWLPHRLPTNGAEVVAELLEDLAHEKTLAAQLDNQLDNGAAIRRQNTLAMQRTTSKGSTRLRDAVVYGYIMQRHALQETVGHILLLRSWTSSRSRCLEVSPCHLPLA